MVGTHRHRLQRPEEGFIEGAVRLVPRLDTTLAPRTGPAQERRPGQHLGPGEQRQRAKGVTAGEQLQDADKVRGRCPQAIDGVRGIAVAIGDAERKDVAFASQAPDLFPIQEAGRDAVSLRETHDIARQALHHGRPDPDGCEAIETRGARQHERPGVPRCIGTKHAILPSRQARQPGHGRVSPCRACRSHRVQGGAHRRVDVPGSGARARVSPAAVPGDSVGFRCPHAAPPRSPAGS